MRLQLSKKGDYALRTMVYLATLTPGDKSTIQDVADTQKIPRRFLEKIVRELGSAGFVRATMGKNGGLELGRPAREISFAEILRVTDGPLQIADCTASAPRCDIIGDCRMTAIFRMLQASADRILESMSLADVVGDEAGCGPAATPVRSQAAAASGPALAV